MSVALTGKGKGGRGSIAKAGRDIEVRAVDAGFGGIDQGQLNSVRVE